MSVKQVTRWQASDGKEYSSREMAEGWESRVEDASKATDMLRDGSSVTDCLRAISYPAEIDAVLEAVTKDTKLVISHWQCQDTPGYKPVYFSPDGRVYAYGNAGCWSGAYGADITIAELVCYAKHTFTKFPESES